MIGFCAAMVEFSCCCLICALAGWVGYDLGVRIYDDWHDEEGGNRR